MGFKQNRWGLAGVALVLAVLVAALLFVARRPGEERVRERIVAHLRATLVAQGLTEGTDFTVGAVEVVSLDDRRALTETALLPQTRAVYHELLFLEGDWVVTKDLYQDFIGFCTAKGNENEFLQRLAKRIQERYGEDLTWKIKAGLQRDMILKVMMGKVVGTVGVRFSYPKTEHGQINGRYLEDFAYEGGTWTLQGGGRLMDVLGP